MTWRVSKNLRRINNMCLRSKSNRYLVAEYDIPCYKVLDNYGVNKYRTPIIGALITDDVLDGTRLMVASGDEHIHEEAYEDWGIGRYCIGVGFIHSYADLSLSKKMTYGLDYRVVFACEIPKGERYFVSSNGTQYASKSLGFVKEC